VVDEEEADEHGMPQPPPSPRLRRPSPKGGLNYPSLPLVVDPWPVLAVSRRSGHRARRVCGVQPDIKSLRLLMTLLVIRDVSRRSGHRARRVCGVQPDIKSLRLLMTLLVIRDGNRSPDIVPYGYSAACPMFFRGVESGSA